MSLLLAELQSQDPTAPMDTTAMVGQMVSLNQLDELMSIQSILQNSLGSGGTATTDPTSGTTSSSSDSQVGAAAAKSNPQAINSAAMVTPTPISNAQSTYAMIAGMYPTASTNSINGVN